MQTRHRLQIPTPGLQPTEAIHQHLGSRVKHFRSARGWSLEVLANASGVSRSMLSQIEREQANPTLAVTLCIARAFGLSLGAMLRNSTRVTPPATVRTCLTPSSIAERAPPPFS